MNKEKYDENPNCTNGSIIRNKRPITRAHALAIKAKEKGHEVAFCAAEDFNYRPVKNVRNYFAPVPPPFGLPLFIGKRVFKLGQQLCLLQLKNIRSYEEVLHIVGATDRRFFPRDVQSIREAIQDFEPDVVFAEFRIAASQILPHIK